MVHPPSPPGAPADQPICRRVSTVSTREKAARRVSIPTGSLFTAEAVSAGDDRVATGLLASDVP
jgi:hypothetical protein